MNEMNSVQGSGPVLMHNPINELATALAKAQGQLKAAKKDSKNPHFKSDYADLESVIGAARSVLAENGLSVVQFPIGAEPGFVALETMLLHSSGQFITGQAKVRLQKDDAQGFGSAITYLRRYCFASVVGVVAGEDDDGNAAVQQPPPKFEVVGQESDSKGEVAKALAAAKTMEELTAIAPRCAKDADLRRAYNERSKALRAGGAQ